MDDMKNNSITLLIIAFIAALIFIHFIGINESIAPTNDTICEHEYVTTSEYVFWTNTYKTISICTKCGKEI